MAFTTIQDVEAFNNTSYTPDQAARVDLWIDVAERDLRSTNAGAWYIQEDRDSDASQDWLLAVAILVDLLLQREDPAIKAALQSPYSSEKMGDYSYSLKDNLRGDRNLLVTDPRLRAIIARYNERSGRVPGGLVTASPTREAKKQQTVLPWSKTIF
jgi:hypothetical protein